MSGLLAFIIIPAGIIAALILFRWARTLVCVGLVLWLLAHHAHAGQTPMVQCTTGSVSQVVPDYACDALTIGYAELRFKGGEDPGQWRCAIAIGRYIGRDASNFIGMCQRMWTIETTHRAQAGYR